MNYKKIVHDGVPGYFVEESYWDSLIEKIKITKKAHAEEVSALQKAVEIADNSSKYKLHKLAKIIERKDKQIASLRDDC